MATLALPVSMKSFKRLLSMVSPDTTVCVRGRHAIGKSEGVYQGAAERFSDFYKDSKNCERLVKEASEAVDGSKKSLTKWSHEMGLPIIERRLSQMTEGDIIGLPDMDGKHTSTQFKPCDWLIQACDFPVVLFLDERNRALEGVKQAVFQLADSKVFYGHHLHPETIIVIAENIGEAYTVNQSDPAEISRAATVELDPDVQEWLEWVKTRCNPMAVDFWRQNQSTIEHHGTYEPNKKYPDRRSWVKLDAELTRLGLYEDASDHMFYVLTGAFVGAEIASQFKKFCIEQDKHVSAADILRDWEKAKARLSRGGVISNEAFVELVAKLGNHLEKHLLTEAQTIEVARFIFDTPPEPRIAAWGMLQKNTKNMLKVHPYVADLIVATATGNDTSKLKLKLPDVAPAAEEPVVKGEKKTPTPRKRGVRR